MSVVKHRMETIIPSILGMEQLVLLELQGHLHFIVEGTKV